MSLFFHSKINNNKKQPRNLYILGLFFTILAILLIFAVYIVKNQQSFQDLGINYYLELDLAQFKQDSNIWLKNNPKRQKILDFWNDYLEKQIPKPSKGLFNGEILLVNLDVPIEENEGEICESHLQEKKNEILLIADIQNQQIAKNYLKMLGSLKTMEDSGVGILTLNKPIFGQKGAYYIFNDQQIMFSLGIDGLNLGKKLKNKINFPSRNSLNSFFVENNFLRFYTKPGKISSLKSILPNQNQPFWLSMEIRPEKLVLNFNEQYEKTEILSDSWLDFLPENNYLAIFSQNLPNILDIQYFANTKNNWQNSYNFNFKKDIYSLLENNQSLLLLTPRSSNYSLKWQDYYFCIIIDKKTFSPNSSEITKVEQIAKNIFAKKFPSEETVFLPDNSTITELISKPEIFQFQIKNLANFSVNPALLDKPDEPEKCWIKYLQKPNLEFAYTFFEDKIAFSNSIGLLEQTLSNNINNQKTKDSLADCLNEQNIPADLIYLNPDSGLEEEFGLKKVIIINKRACIY